MECWSVIFFRIYLINIKYFMIDKIAAMAFITLPSSLISESIRLDD